MGWLNSFSRWTRRLLVGDDDLPSASRAVRRRCRFETFESRRMLDANPLFVGATYFERDLGSDVHGDTFELTFTGGAPGTELTSVVIDGDQTPGNNNGNPQTLAQGDVFFDTQLGGMGADNAFPFTIVSNSGIDSVKALVNDGSTRLELQFTGFQAGDKLVFSIDVDQMVKVNLTNPNLGVDPITSGIEFEDSSFDAQFTAPHYYDASGSSKFINAYDPNFAGTNLDLPPDNYQGLRDRSAGAVIDMQQTPLPVTISGNVWHDQNLNLQHDTGEEGIAGVNLQLWKQDDTGAYVNTGYTTTTDAQGNYEFGAQLKLKPGTYRVLEGPAAGYPYDVGAVPGSVDGVTTGATDPADPRNILTGIAIPLGGEHAVHYDFAEAKPASVSGYVYNDHNNNGVRQPGEEGIGGVRVELVPVSTIAPQSPITVTTATGGPNGAGYYEFTGIAPGTYRIVELDQPAGFVDGTDAAGTVNGVTVGAAVNPGDEIHGVALNSGDHGVEYDFGEIQLGSISGWVSVGTAGGDCLGPTAPNYRPLAGVTITLLDDHGNAVATQITDANGLYSFAQLRPGTYSVVEGPTPGYVNGEDEVGRINGVTVGANTSSDVLSQIRLGPGDNGVDYAFCEHEPATLSGYVYHDANDTGVFDAGDDPLGGQTVKLLDAGGNVVGSATTDATGFYQFSGLSLGTYTVMEMQPAGYLNGTDNVGTVGGVPVGQALTSLDKITNVSLQFGDHGINYNFGEILPVCLSGYVYSDANNSGVFDAGDNPLPNQTVMIVNSAGATVATAKTDANGYYDICGLPPDTYTVMEVQPPGYANGPVNVGTVDGVPTGQANSALDKITQVVLKQGETGVNYNFGEVLPATISGYVFQDGPPILAGTNVSTVRDGRLTPDDARLAGVVLELRDGVTGMPIDGSAAMPGFYGPGPIRTTTDANGYYQFSGLPAGNYAVYEVQPAGYLDSIDTPGTTGGYAFNPSDPPPASVTATLLADPHNDAIVRIEVAQGQSSQQNNFSEVKLLQPFPQPNPPVPPPPGAPPSLVVLSPVAPKWLPTPPPQPEPALTGYGGEMPFTWHLSVVDGGAPRGDAGAGGVADGRQNVFRLASQVKEDESRWTADRLASGVWSLTKSRGANDPAAVHQFIFGVPGGQPVVGDFNGDGVDEIGVFLEGEWFLDLNGNGRWDENDLWARLGEDGDQPVAGDWDGDGKDDIGIFGPMWAGDARAINREPGLPDSANLLDGQPHDLRPKNLPPQPHEATDGVRELQRTKANQPREDLIDHVFQYGRGQDIGVTGDWNGDGIRTVGVFRNGKWLVDTNGDGKFTRADKTFDYGERGDLPVVGDFNGDGIEEIGVYRAGQWHIDIDGNREMDAHDRVFELGGAEDLPVVGDFDGDGVDDPGLFRGAAR